MTTVAAWLLVALLVVAVVVPHVWLVACPLAVVGFIYGLVQVDRELNRR